MTCLLKSSCRIQTINPLIYNKQWSLMPTLRQFTAMAANKILGDVQLLQNQDTPLSKRSPVSAHITFTMTKELHTTPRREINPLVWALVKPMGKLWSMLWGRAVRNWWKKLPDEKRQHYKDLFKGLRKFFYSFFAVLLVGLGINYIVHYEENPFTGRRRFVGMTNEQLAKQAQYETEGLAEEYKDKILNEKSPIYETVHACMNRLVKLNRQVITEHGPAMWKLFVVDDLEIENAFVLPNGSVFVFTGLLNEMDNVDQLAVILSHEMAHVLMKHSAESLSKAQILDYFVIVTMAAIWIILPNDGIAAVTTWFYEKLRKYMIDLPFSRELETEADQVGLELAARACYDVREAPVLWSLNDARSKLNSVKIPALLSTHPPSADRAENLTNRMEHCLKIRCDAGCPELRTPNPMLRAEKRLAALQASPQQKSEQTAGTVIPAQKR